MAAAEQSLEPTDAVKDADRTGADDDKAGKSDGAGHSSPKSPRPPKSPRSSRLLRFKWFRHHLTVYSIAFLLVLVIAAAIIGWANYQNRRPASTDQVKTQGLSQSVLDQLAKSDVTVGNNQSVLNVRSSAVFAGSVLIRQGLQVAGNLKIAGTTSFGSLVVSGTSQFGQVNINKSLSVSGNTALQGTATVGGSLQVGGGGTFHGNLSAPQITTNGLQLNGDLTLSHHIQTNGGQPSRSGGAALGGGGSVSLSGTDIAGSVNINTGSGPAAGCFVTVNFTNRYSSTPHVLVTPVGSAAGGLNYYVNRSSTSFSICDSSTPPAGHSFSFDYFVID